MKVDKGKWAVLIMMFTILLLVSFANASKSYDKDTSTYKTKNFLFFKKYDISLDTLYDSVIDAQAGGHLEVYRENKVFKKLYYKDLRGNDYEFDLDKNEEYQFYLNTSTLWYRKVNVTYEEINCQWMAEYNQTVCDQNETGYDWEEYYVQGWEEVDINAKIPVGSYRWKIIAKKPLNKVIDFIITTDDEGDLIEWAWWNTTFNFKQNITNLSGEFPSFNISFNANMQSDWDDLRFLNEDEDTELNYTIRTNVSSDWAFVTVDTNNDSEIYMYFGNSLVSTTENTSNTFLEATNMWFLDDGISNAITTLDASNFGSTPQVAAYVSGGYDLDGTSQRIDLPTSAFPLGSADRTINLWINPDAVADNDIFIGYGEVATGKFFGMRYKSAGGVLAFIGITCDVSSNQTISTSSWQMITASYDGTDLKLYVNGVLGYDASPCGVNTGTSAGGAIGNVIITTVGIEGKADEPLVWDRALTQSEIDKLFSILEQTPVFGSVEPLSTLNISLISPEDNEIFNVSSVSFNCTCINGVGCNTLNMTVDGTIVNTTSGGGATNLTTIYTNASMPDGQYEWFCNGSSLIEDASSSIFNFSVDTTTPIINISSPVTSYTILFQDQSIDLNYTITEQNPSECSFVYNNSHNISSANFTLDHAVTGSVPFYFLNNSGAPGSFFGDLTFNAIFGPEGGKVLTTSGFTNLANWTDALDDPNCFDQTFDSPSVKWANTSGFNAGKYVCANLLSGDQAIIQFQGAGDTSFNWTLNRVPIDCTATESAFLYQIGSNELTVFANDSVGHEANLTRSWTVATTLENITFNGSTFETATENFKVVFLIDPSIIAIEGILNYNGTRFTTGNSCTGTLCQVNTSIDIPLLNNQGASENRTWFLEITSFTANDSSSFNTSDENQMVEAIFLEECNATYTVQTVNFTAFDEQNLTRIDPFLFEFDTEFWLGTGTVRRQNNFSDSSTSEVTLCIEPTNRTFFLEGEVEYDEVAPGTIYTLRNYYFQNTPFTNVSTHIELGLLLASASTSFILKVQDAELLPSPDVLIFTERFYTGLSQFKVVQVAKTDDNGASVGFFEAEIGDYRFVIKQNDVTLLITPITGSQKVVGETAPFTLTFTIGDPDEAAWAPYEPIDELSAAITYNKSGNIISYSYTDTSGDFSSALFNVFQINNSGQDILVCTDSSTQSSAVISCNMTGNSTGTYIGRGFITRGTEQSLVVQESFTIEDFTTTSGRLGLFLGWLLILISSFTFRFNEIAGIIAVNGTMIFTNIIGLVAFGPVWISAWIAMSIFILVVLER